MKKEEKIFSLTDYFMKAPHFIPRDWLRSLLMDIGGMSILRIWGMVSKGVSFFKVKTPEKEVTFKTVLME